MESGIYLTTPIFVNKIWGGSMLKKYFNYDIPSDSVGECWGISALPGSDTQISDIHNEHSKLNDFWQLYALKNNLDSNEFPILYKIISANDNLSIQVHPDDKYANEHENGAYGKFECWYILDCHPGSKLFVGHNLKNKHDFKNAIEKDHLINHLISLDVKPGDFITIPTGTVHAINSNILLAEIQQPSDLTYRIYDYNRLQKNNKPRDLHIDKSLDVINFNQKPHVISNFSNPNNGCIDLLSHAKFNVKYICVDNKFNLTINNIVWSCCVLDGNGTINNIKINKGDFFIITNEISNIEFSGKLKILCAVC